MKYEELRIGDNLKVIYVGGEVKYYTITGIDDIKLRDEHSSLSAGSTESYAEVTELDPPLGQLYWIYRISSRHNVKIYLKQPAATNRWGTNTAPEGGMLTDLTGPIIPVIDESKNCSIWIAKNYPPCVQLVNDTDVTITPVLWWIGKRFSVQELPKPPAIFTIVKIGGIAD